MAWGNNAYGQCDIPSPNADFVAIAAGYFHSLGLKSDGTIVAWGNNAYGQCDIPSPNADFVTVAGGMFHNLGLKSDGTIVAWGWNNYGQCNVPSPNADFVAVAAGFYHSLGLKSDGTIVAWGDNGAGQCNVPSPNADFVAVARGYDHSLGLRAAPICSVSPISLDFGFVTIGQQKDLAFSATNTGGGRLTGSIVEACEYFSIAAGGGAYDLGRGDSVLVTVRFAPLTTSAAACTISTGGTCGSVVCAGTGDRAPHVYAVRDVPGDQGGFLNLSWDASPGDNVQEHAITRYTVWRAIEPTAAELASLAPGSFIARVSDLSPEAKKDVVRLELAGSLKYYWKLISSLDAYYLEGYSEVVPTLFDSTAVCTEYHYVQIIAHTSDPYTFWVSPPDSGRSVDNLAPEEPLRLAGEQSYSPAGLNLTWEPNSEADLAGYAIYRGTVAGFVPGPGNIVASTPDTLYLDGEWRWGGSYYYKVAAVDIHGNESGYAILTPEEITGDETPKAPAATYLSQNFPNPFNPATKVAFGLAEPASVRLRIYDAAGRLVRALAEGTLPAGHYAKVWNGRDARGASVASGIYFYRLEAGAFMQTRKMVLLR